MATSGSVDYQLNAGQLIKEAFNLCGMLEGEETVPGEMDTDARRSLNLMAKSWMAEFGQLWKKEVAVLFLTVGQAEYSLGPTSTDHAALLDDAVKTEMAVAGVATDSTIQVDSITGIANADVIGIVLDSGLVHWTTVNGAPSGSTVTLTVALPSAAAIDNHVYAYTTLLRKPLVVSNARRRDASEQDIPLHRISHQEYWDLPNKTSTGVPVQVQYIPRLQHGELLVWPAPSSANDRLILTVRLPIEDFDAAIDDPDFPQEWLETLTVGLALRLCLKYPVPQDRFTRLQTMYAGLKPTLRHHDTERASIYIMPDERFAR